MAAAFITAYTRREAGIPKAGGVRAADQRFEPDANGTLHCSWSVPARRCCSTSDRCNGYAQDSRCSWYRQDDAPGTCAPSRDDDGGTLSRAEPMMTGPEPRSHPKKLLRRPK